MNKTKLVASGLLAAAALAAGSSAMAYQQWVTTNMYGPGVIVEYQGRVFQHDNGYSRGETPMAGSSFRWGNPWDDKGAVGTVVSTQPPASSTPSTPSSPSAPAWASGSNYAKGAVVSYNGVRYQSTVAISASEFASLIAPSKTSWRWTRA
ncbi:chitodextrinase [Variovorax boronicumulans]|uniref:carbohydrate-binding protein n=1 Tax=Variovorax boronicumulans TaxID=436515 RepID=UPI002780927B|nr:carbohydrate-binding protein [Variovorax boronicumulans]MDQ0086069.1 chitodextrinase [Variovorax boronicumulans]